MRRGLYLILFLVSGLTVSSCTSVKNNSSQVVLWAISDPLKLNPILAHDISSIDLDNNLFQPLLNFDYRTLKLVPVLAVTMPDVKVDSSGRMFITYELRKDAKWDNGTPVTAKDAEFTLKVIKCPVVDDEYVRTYFDKVNDIILYPDNPLKFTVVYNEKYMLAVAATGTGMYILPQYAYDSANYLGNFTVKQISTDTMLAHNDKMIAFGKEFNSEKYSREQKHICGSGAYKLVSWTTGQEVVLEKKTNWWGDANKSANCFFEANPAKLIYRTISDMTSAVVALKAGNLDAITYIKPSDFDELSKSDKFTQSFNTYTPLRLLFTFVAVNKSNPKFEDVRTRRAIAYLMDIPTMMKDVYYGYATQITGPVSPSDSADYNFDLKPYEFNIDSAKALLAAAGWKDNDGNGVLEKNIGGKKTELEIDYLFNAANEQQKKVGLIFKEAARKAGIVVNILPQEFNVYAQKLQTHNYDVCLGMEGIPPGPLDFKQLYYTTEAQNGGSNFACFGNAASDALIDSFRTELDPVKRASLSKRFVQLLHDDCSYIFLFAQKGTIAISKKFSNAYSSSNNPYYWEAGFSENTK